MTLDDRVNFAVDNGINKDTPLDVREALIIDITENGWADHSRAMELTGLQIDSSGAGRPEYYISVPTPTDPLPF